MWPEIVVDKGRLEVVAQRESTGPEAAQSWEEVETVESKWQTETEAKAKATRYQTEVRTETHPADRAAAALCVAPAKWRRKWKPLGIQPWHGVDIELERARESSSSTVG